MNGWSLLYGGWRVAAVEMNLSRQWCIQKRVKVWSELEIDNVRCKDKTVKWGKIDLKWDQILKVERVHVSVWDDVDVCVRVAKISIPSISAELPSQQTSSMSGRVQMFKE